MGLDGLDEPDVGLEKGELEEDCTTINILCFCDNTISKK